MTATQIHNLRSLLRDTEHWCVEHECLPWAMLFVPVDRDAPALDRIAAVGSLPTDMIVRGLRTVAYGLEEGRPDVILTEIAYARGGVK